MHSKNLSAIEALERLKCGNDEYVTTSAKAGDVSAEIRKYTNEHGQSPFAIVIACSDSRVIPETIFSAGIGELFVIRVAGNVIDNHQLGSIEYAAEHLGCKLVLLLGHTHCGAVAAALGDNAEGYIKYIVDDIQDAIGGERNPYAACRLNVEHGIRMIESSLEIQREEHDCGLQVHGAIYDIETGKVDFFDWGR